MHLIEHQQAFAHTNTNGKNFKAKALFKFGPHIRRHRHNTRLAQWVISIIITLGLIHQEHTHCTDRKGLGGIEVFDTRHKVIYRKFLFDDHTNTLSQRANHTG